MSTLSAEHVFLLNNRCIGICNIVDESTDDNVKLPVKFIVGLIRIRLYVIEPSFGVAI